MFDVVAFCYDADFHCIECAERKFGIDALWDGYEIEDFSPVDSRELEDYVYNSAQQRWEQDGEFAMIECECGTCREFIKR